MHSDEKTSVSNSGRVCIFEASSQTGGDICTAEVSKDPEAPIRIKRSEGVDSGIEMGRLWCKQSQMVKM